MVRVLRPTRISELVSARAFDEQFLGNLGVEIDLVPTPLLPWLDAILGVAGSPHSLELAARQFAQVTQGFDLICPNYEGNLLAPLLLRLRNIERAPTRLLFIAHAPGAHLLEWALMAPHLAPGDVIVAPSASAASLIAFLCPDLNPYVRIIPHPMRAMPRRGARVPAQIVSLGRIIPQKLIHRQIEAIAILRSRGIDVELKVAGPLTDAGSTSATEYVRTLAAKIRRFNLGEIVELVGEIEGGPAKARFLSGASILLNLSVTNEESFGKSIVEALGLGVAVLATNWNGFGEVVGPGGSLLAVCDAGLGLDIGAEQLADGLEQMLSAPASPAMCRKQARRFSPAQIAPKYRKVLEQALLDRAAPPPGGSRSDWEETSAAPRSGLLAHTAPLGHFSGGELFRLHVHDCERLRRRFSGEDTGPASDADRLRSILLNGTQAAIGRFLGGMNHEALSTPVSGRASTLAPGAPFNERLAQAARSSVIPRSALACLVELSTAGDGQGLSATLQGLADPRLDSPGLDWLRAETERQRGDHLAAFQRLVNQDDPRMWGESAAYRLQQLAQIGRGWDRPAFTLPWLKAWLTAFPDSPDSSAVWRDYCLNATLAGDDFLGEARHAFAAAVQLSAPSPMLRQLERHLWPAAPSAASSEVDL